MSNNVRELFPVTREKIYVNHAGTGPMSLPAQRAVAQCVDIYLRQAEFDLDAYVERVRRARATVARLINAAPEEIVFTHNTSEGIYIALINLPLREGDSLLIMDEVFPAVRYVADYNLPHIEKKYVPFLGRNPVDVVRKQRERTTRAVVIDYVHFLTGEVIDIHPLAAFCRQEDIYLVVDGIQAIGAIDFSVQNTPVDFLACGAAKWLFGPSGAGFLYIGKKHFKLLNKFHTGWLGAEWSGFESISLSPPLYDDARMFEQGTRNIIGISAFAENVKVLRKYGLEKVEQEILALKQQLRHGFRDLNFEIITPAQGQQSGIISIRPQQNAKSILEHCARHNVVISLRNDCLRFSPHFYNTSEEIATVLDLLSPRGQA
jgi:selenocysteine lyase/cysteine desulfurase